MTITILNEKINNDIDTGLPFSRTVEIAIDDGQGNEYRWLRGGLPLTGDLQAILDAEEAELLTAAQAAGSLFDVFNVAEKKVLKALALVILDEINILRSQHGLALRDESQIRGAIKNKLASP